jgi:hypothetical protein
MKFIHPEKFISDYSQSRYRGFETNDCVVKAVSILFGIPYDEAHGFSRGFFNRTEKVGVYNFTSSMRRLMKNQNFSFNGSVNEIDIDEHSSIHDVYSEYNEGVFLVVTNDHVSVLFEGHWLDYKGIIKQSEDVYAVYEFIDFDHFDSIRKKIAANNNSSFDFWLIAIVLVAAFLFFNEKEVKHELRNFKKWVKREIHFDF